jgi:Domain of unknown function (DUF6456)
MSDDHQESADLQSFITTLAHRGAIAERAAGNTVVRYPGNGKPMTRHFPARALDQALAQGLVMQAGSSGSHVLCQPGRQWLKRQTAHADPFRSQHQARRIDFAVRQGDPVMVDDAESPLAWLRRRTDAEGQAILSDAQYQAGERLRSDYTFAQLEPRTTSDWSGLAAVQGRRGGGGGGGASADLRDNVIRAKQRINAALTAVGPELSGILVDVCCHLRGLETVESTAGWPRRSAKIVLLLGLSALARHYGLTAPNSARASGTAPVIRHWGTSDYRPSLNEQIHGAADQSAVATGRGSDKSFDPS